MFFDKKQENNLGPESNLNYVMTVTKQIKDLKINCWLYPGNYDSLGFTPLAHANDRGC